MIKAILALLRPVAPAATGWYAPLNEPMDFWPDDICAPAAGELPEHWADEKH